VLRLASEDALLLSRDYGLKFYEDGYDFLVYDHVAGRWRPIDGDTLLVRHTLDRMLLELRVEDRDVTLGAAADVLMSGAEADSGEDDSEDAAGEEDAEELLPVPDVVIYSSGEITPFELRILNTIEPLEPDVVLSVEFDGNSEIGHDEI
jgi:general secretion pathway protein H